MDFYEFAKLHNKIIQKKKIYDFLIEFHLYEI